MTDTASGNKSPGWGSTTKLVVGLTIVAIVAALLIRFRNFIGPLILAIILAYLLHPLAEWLSNLAKISWRAAVNIVYLLFVVLLMGLSTLTGLAVSDQIQSLIAFVQRFVNQLPELAENLSSQVYVIGPFELNFGQFDIQTLTEQILGILQPVLGRAGGLISTFATSAVGVLGWIAFVLLVSYFLLADASRVQGRFLGLDIPGYASDSLLLGRELKKIWDAYIRGQLIIIVLVIISYSILMTVLGVRFAIGIAILAGLARFVPYVGPLTSGIVTALVAFFQVSNHFGLDSLSYAILVVVASILLDQIYDNLITPRFLGAALGVHPAAVLVAALIATNLIGFIGLVLAAPVLATIQLIGRYTVRKMFDLDPWPEDESLVQPIEMPWARWMRQLKVWWRKIRRQL
jgi:predicted PurR-regulated permease PerM